MRLFVTYKKGYDDVFDKVEKIEITRKDNINQLKIIYWFGKKEIEYIPLRDIELTFLIDLDTMQEYFRYEK